MGYTPTPRWKQRLGGAFIATTAPSAAQWHRQKGQLKLREEDHDAWNKLTWRFRRYWAARIRSDVNSFLDQRFSEQDNCPMDGCRIPLIHRQNDGAVAPWRFAWCGYCQEGFLCVRDEKYGWEHYAALIWDADRRKYVLDRYFAAGGIHPLNAGAVCELLSSQHPMQ